MEKQTTEYKGDQYGYVPSLYVLNVDIQPLNLSSYVSPAMISMSIIVLRCRNNGEVIDDISAENWPIYKWYSE
jgi:hypothetical protein